MTTHTKTHTQTCMHMYVCICTHTHTQMYVHTNAQLSDHHNTLRNLFLQVLHHYNHPQQRTFTTFAPSVVFMPWWWRCRGRRGGSTFGELCLECHHAVVRAEVSHRGITHSQMVLGWCEFQTLVAGHCLVGLGLQDRTFLPTGCEDCAAGCFFSFFLSPFLSSLLLDSCIINIINKYCKKNNEPEDILLVYQIKPIC